MNPPREASAAGQGAEPLAWRSGFAPEARAEPDEPLALLEGLQAARRPIERYRLVAEVGRGATSGVLRVRDRDLGRDLAMKVLVAEDGEDGGRAHARFLEQARVAGQLDHPGIVPVHEVGLDLEGRAFYTMKLVEGRDLGEVLGLAREEREGWSRTRALGVLLRVCEALAHAHARGVVHGHLEPSKVRVGDFGAVYVVDWGKARRERAAGPHEATAVGAQRDVRAVGALLQELCAPAAADVPAELTAITERATASDAERRYPTMQALADDLRAFLEGRVVSAHETGALAEIRKWVRRNRELAGAMAAGLLLALGGLSATLWVQARAHDRERASRQRLASINRELEQTGVALRAAHDEARESEERAARRALEAQREKQSADRVADFLVGLFRSPDPVYARGEEITARQVLDRGVTGIESAPELDPVVRARLCESMGIAYHSLGRYRESLALLTENLRACEEHAAELGPERLLRARWMQARARLSMGEAGALDGFRQVVRELSATLGETHPDTLQARTNLVMWIETRSSLEEACEASLELLDDVERVLGPDDMLTLSLLGLRARCLRAEGHWAEGGEALEQVWMRMSRALGEDHPATLTALNDVANFCFSIDDIPRATELFERAVELGSRVLGPRHADQLSLQGNLAQCYVRYRRYDEAERLELEVLDHTRELFGDQSERTAACLGNLSTTYLYQGRLDDAEESALAALDALVDQDPRTSPVVHGALCNLAHIAARRGDDEQAERLFLERLAAQRELHGDDHRDTLAVEWMLATFYRGRGRLAEALPLAEELVRHTPPQVPRHAERLRLRDQLRAALAAQGGASRAADPDAGGGADAEPR